jgi:hypothetical protein
METADESYKAEIEKFKEEMNDVLKQIDILVYVLERGAVFTGDSVNIILSRYEKIPDDIQKAFCDLKKNAGDIIIPKAEDEKTDFVERCFLSWKQEFDGNKI